MSSTSRQSFVIAAVVAVVPLFFVSLEALDSASSNVITVPSLALVADAVVGLAAVLCVRAGMIRVPILLSALSVASAGAATVCVALSARSRSWGHTLVVSAAFALCWSVRWALPWVVPAPYQDSVAGLLLIGTVTAAAVGWGLYFRAEDTRFRQALETEAMRLRLDLAREMHDGLAHRLTVIAMSAGALESRDSVDRDERRELAGAMATSSRQALSELRSILSELRSPSAPLPSLESVPALVEEWRAQGRNVEVSGDLPGGDVDVEPHVERHVYRIIQEGLANAMKYGVGDPELNVRTTDGWLELGVVNSVPDSVQSGDPGEPGPGMGLRGMAERARLCGGTLTHKREGGTFTLTARIPLEGVR